MIDIRKLRKTRIPPQPGPRLPDNNGASAAASIPAGDESLKCLELTVERSASRRERKRTRLALQLPTRVRIQHLHRLLILFRKILPVYGPVDKVNGSNNNALSMVDDVDSHINHVDDQNEDSSGLIDKVSDDDLIVDVFQAVPVY
ncbi:hypothetical protein NDU88_007328 [Pleurodeles waltl]|uniref:Uncharacterized protein n=1 Tax=Pleurodeles waltl TaxID=8319 RepID=A0AAV7MEW4_PLEWA|nr:hypothetical protein NDU88_007328 [Pleurodeles waltl]